MYMTSDDRARGESLYRNNQFYSGDFIFLNSMKVKIRKREKINELLTKHGSLRIVTIRD